MSLDDLTADLDTHRIEGHAVHGNTPFSVSLISHIEGNLWVGGCLPHVKLPEDFKYVLSLYPWERYVLSIGTMRFEARLHDSNDEVDADKIDRIANKAVYLLEKGQTLIHCQAGLNRSNLIAGLALIKLGRTPEQAVALLREKRCSAVLCNKTFERYLLSQGAS